MEGVETRRVVSSYTNTSNINKIIVSFTDCLLLAMQMESRVLYIKLYLSQCPAELDIFFSMHEEATYTELVLLPKLWIRSLRAGSTSY